MNDFEKIIETAREMFPKFLEENKEELYRRGEEGFDGREGVCLLISEKSTHTCAGAVLGTFNNKVRDFPIQHRSGMSPQGTVTFILEHESALGKISEIYRTGNLTSVRTPNYSEQDFGIDEGGINTKRFIAAVSGFPYEFNHKFIFAVMKACDLIGGKPWELEIQAAHRRYRESEEHAKQSVS